MEGGDGILDPSSFIPYPYIPYIVSQELLGSYAQHVMLSDAHVCLGLRTVTLRLSLPVAKPGRREFCVCVSCSLSLVSC